MSGENLNTSGERHPLLSTIYSSPQTAAALSKLVHQPKNINSSGVRDTKDAAEASRGELFNASLAFQDNMRDQENAMEVFSDLEMTKQTVISLLLAPNNMTQEDMNYAVNHPFISPDVGSKITNILKDQLEGYYGLQEKLFTIVEDAMFTKGAHVRMVLPESAVDHLINNRNGMRVESREGFIKTFKEIESSGHGFLGPSVVPEGFRFESYENSRDWIKNPISKDGEIIASNISVSDNFGLLKLPSWQLALRKESVRGRVRGWQKMVGQPSKSAEPNVRTENFKPSQQKVISDEELKNSIYKSAPAGSDLFLRIPESDNLSRHSLGRPLAMNIPPEAMIPVHFPGEPERHIGAFLLLDDTGHFLNAEAQRRSLTNFANIQNQAVTSNATTGSKDGIGSSLLEKARQGIKGSDNTEPLRYLTETFGSLLEEDLLRRVRNGIHGAEAALIRNNDIYMVMLARSLAGSNTQIVYIPKEFYTYFAFQYNANGTGRSFLADVKYLISLRSISLFAKIANQVRNAISITDINVELDPRDPSPQRTMEKIIDLSSQTRAQFFPWGLNTPSDIANWWHRAGMQMHVTGHKGIPATKIEYVQRSHDKNVPTIDDDETLNDMIHMRFGITPEMRDAGKGAQFATSIANQNILLTKRILQLQKTMNKLLSDYGQVVANNDSFIVNKIRTVIKENWGNLSEGFDDVLKNFVQQDQEEAIDFFLNETIDSIEVTLPKPDLTSVRNQLEAFQAFKEAVEETFDYVISDDAISQAVMGEAASVIVSCREPLKAQIYRDWMLSNNFLPELFDLVSVNSDTAEGSSELTTQTVTHLKGLAKNMFNFMKVLKPVTVAVAEDFRALSPEEVDEDPGY